MVLICVLAIRAQRSCNKLCFFPSSNFPQIKYDMNFGCVCTLRIALEIYFVCVNRCTKDKHSMRNTVARNTYNILKMINQTPVSSSAASRGGMAKK